MERALRIGNRTSQTTVAQPSMEDVDRSLRIEEDSAIRDKVDRLYALKNTLRARNDAHKQETVNLESQIKELAAAVRGWADEHGKSRVTGVTAVAEFSPGVSRAVDPKKLLNFLKELGKTGEFWDFVKVPIGEITKIYGESVLESAGVLQVESDPRGNMKVIQNSN